MKSTLIPNYRQYLLLTLLEILIAVNLSAQEKIYPIKTTAHPSQLTSYNVDETDGKIELLFTKKGKKEDVYSNYVFDKNLALVKEVEEEQTKEKAKAKYTFWDAVDYSNGGTIGEIIKDNVLTVENNATGVMSIKKGYIGMTMRKNPMTGGMVKAVGFVEREKVKPKMDDNRKLTLVTFQTDAPGEYFSNTLTQNADNQANFGREKVAGLGTKLLSDATGDVLIVSSLASFGVLDGQKEKLGSNDLKFLAQRFSATTLEKLEESPFELGYIAKMLFKQEATDGSGDLLLIMAPYTGIKQYVHPNKNEYTYLRIGKNTKIKEKINFNSPYGRLNNISINNFGNATYLFSTSEEGNKDKYFLSISEGRHKDDQLITIKFKDGKQEYLTSTPIASLISITNEPKNIYSGKGFIQKSIVSLKDGAIFISGQGFTTKETENIYTNIFGFLINGQGKITNHYVLPKLEANGLSEKASSPQNTSLLNDGSILWGSYEFTKKGNMYPKYAKINNGALGPLVFPGDKKYVVNDIFPVYLFSNKKELLYFGNTEDNKQFWLHKISF